MNLTLTNWPLGWTPSSDECNGDRNGLLRMDNLQLEEDGAIGLTRGYHELGGNYVDSVSDLYDKVINGQETIWVGLENGREVFRTDLAGFSSQNVLILNGGTRPCFGDGLGQVIACSGTQKKKDDGNIIRDLGIPTQTAAPEVFDVGQKSIDLVGSGGGVWTTIEGNSLSSLPPSSFKLYVDPTTLRGVAEIVFDNPVNTLDTGDGAANNPNDDTFYFLVQPHDTDEFTSFRVEIYLSLDGLNYYWMEWPLSGSAKYNLGIATQSTLSARRGDFTRQGNDSSLDWTDVVKVRIIANAISETWFAAGEMKFTGGAAGQLNGYYQYLQIDVLDNGIYVAKGGVSPISDPVLVINGFTEIQLQPPLSFTDANQTWLFRKSVPTTQFQELINLNGQNINVPIPTALDQFYLVGKFDVNTFITDNTSDQDAIKTNITANLFLVSMQDLTEPVIGMEGIYNERMLYLTASQLLLSDRLNIDAYDKRYSIKAFGDPSERNLWIKKVNNNVLILATTKDLYEISGTLLDLPDGTIDANVRAIGEAFVPLSQDVAASDGVIFYPAADGYRMTSGSNSVPVDPNNKLSLLFQKFPRYGVPDFNSNPGNTTRYPITVGRGKLYVGVQCSDGTRRLLIYDLRRQSWRLQFTDPTVLFRTLSNRILAGYGLGSGNFVQEIEYGTDGTVDAGQSGQTGQPLFLQTVYDHNGQPRNRKDTFTLKVVMDTGGQPVQVLLGADDQGFTVLTDVHGNQNVSSSFQTTFFFDLHAYTLGFRYAIQIKGTNLIRFKLWEYTIEYEPRPEQNVFYRILDTDFGTNCRKRIVSYPLVIDTIQKDVHLTIYGDGGQIDTNTINTNGKWTFSHFFTKETVGTFYGATLSGGPFEFYNFDQDSFISEKLPQPARFLVIPATNIGLAARKRIRTIPIVINTRGINVKYTPILDGQLQPTSTIFNSGADQKKTLWHYFGTDVFPVDIGGILQNTDNTQFPFEFYEFGQFENVESLPVGKIYDQIGPARFDKIGKMFKFRIRLISFDASIPFKVVSENEASVPTYAAQDDFDGTISASVGVDQIYEVNLPKSVNGAIFRLVLGPTANAFHRYDCQFLVAESGMESSSRWVPVR